MNFPFLSTIILSPFVGALIILAINPRKKLVIKLIALIASLISLVCSVIICFLYDRNQGGFQFLEKIVWIKSLGISYSLGVDGISLPMVLLTGIIIFTAVLISWEIKPRPKEFFIWLLLLVSGVFGVFSSLNLFFFFFFYELAVLPMYLLIGIWGSGPKEYGALKLTLQLLVASVFILIGILIIYTFSGTFDLVALSRENYSLGFQRALFPLLCLGFGVLAGMWPLHTWSPIGHSTAPTAGSMLHAGVLMKLGAYGIIRVAISLFPIGAQFWVPFVAILAIINVVYGALIAMAQEDFKYVIAYSSVSHMGIVLLGLTTLNSTGLNGALFQMFSHGIMTGAFFALVGIVYERSHTRQIAEMGGFASRMPFVASIFVLAGLTSLGLPGTSGFIAEFLVFVGVFKEYPIIPIFAVLGSAITAGYVLRVARRVFFGPINSKFEHLTDAKPLEIAALTILAFVLILFGLFPSLISHLINLGIVPLITKVGGGII